MRLYDTQKWKRKRKRISRESGYLCELCLRKGIRASAEAVHHIVPLKCSDTLKLKDYNLISLCWQCHEKLHKRQSHKLTDAGIELVKELVQQNYIPARVLDVISKA